MQGDAGGEPRRSEKEDPGARSARGLSPGGRAWEALHPVSMTQRGVARLVLAGGRSFRSRRAGTRNECQVCRPSLDQFAQPRGRSRAKCALVFGRRSLACQTRLDEPCGVDSARYDAKSILLLRFRSCVEESFRAAGHFATPSSMACQRSLQHHDRSDAAGRGAWQEQFN